MAAALAVATAACSASGPPGPPAAAPAPAPVEPDGPWALPPPAQPQPLPPGILDARPAPRVPTAPAPTVPVDVEPVVRGTAWFSGARSTDGGRGLVLTFVGGSVETPRSSPCWEDYRAEVDESDATVRVTIQRLSPPPVPRPPEEPSFACTTEGYFRSLDVRLSSPLGARSLVDGADGRVKPVFDGARLLVPARLPEGWVLGREEPYQSLLPNGGDLQEWVQWYGPRSERGAARCTATEHGLLVTTGAVRPDLPIGVRAVGDTLLGQPTIRGHQAELVHESWHDQVVLSWDEPQAGYTIRTMPVCGDGSRPDPAAVVAFARSLRPAR